VRRARVGRGSAFAVAATHLKIPRRAGGHAARGVRSELQRLTAHSARAVGGLVALVLHRARARPSVVGVAAPTGVSRRRTAIRGRRRAGRTPAGNEPRIARSTSFRALAGRASAATLCAAFTRHASVRAKGTRASAVVVTAAAASTAACRRVVVVRASARASRSPATTQSAASASRTAAQLVGRAAPASAIDEQQRRGSQYRCETGQASAGGPHRRFLLRKGGAAGACSYQS
jgi:hypothetical protein